MPDIKTGEPASFVRGESISWTRNLSLYLPADGWTLTYYLVNADQRETIIATDNSDGTHLVALTAAQSVKYAPDDHWHWQAVVTKGDDLHVVDDGVLVVLVGYKDLDSGHDARSFWQKALDLAEDLMLNAALNSELSVSVDGYSATFEDRHALLVYRARCQAHVDQEQLAADRKAGRPASRNVAVRF